MLAQLLGGRIAEEVVLGEITTGAGNDIERASEIARRMVCDWGMSERVGLRNLGSKGEEIFLGREITQHRDYSEETARLIDAEVKRIIDEAYATGKKIITEHLEQLEWLAEALLKHEILDGREIDLILAGETLENTSGNPAKADEQEKTQKEDGTDHESS
jgi:cell division protease FtsH